MNVNQIEDEVDRLNTRVKRYLHNGDFVAIGYSNGGWHVRCPFGSVMPCRGETPEKALEEFDRQLKIVEAKKQEAA